MAAISRLQARIKENFQETTRDISLLTTGSASSSAAYFDTSDEKIKEISKLLESRIEAERLEGMKRIIAGMSKGRDMEPFFAQVVKNVVSTSVEIRKLVYIYLLRFASTNADLLLLSINTFQKDLSDPSPLIRSMSLRVLTSIRVPVIQGIVMLGLKRLVNDRNPWVRKTVAGGLAKVYGMDSSTLSQLIPILQSLLASHSPLTLGATLTAFEEICPDQLDLLHPYYRHICRLLMDADEWGQIVALQVLTRYARTMLEKPDPTPAAQLNGNNKSPGGKPAKQAGENDEESEDEFAGIDVDLAMLLHCAKPLLQSRNPAVVFQTAMMYFHLAPLQHKSVGQGLITAPLLKLASTAEEQIASLTWEVISAIIVERPALFTSRYSSFFLHVSDPPHVKIAKLHAMTRLMTPINVKTCMREFKQYLRHPEDEVAEEAIKAIGQCIQIRAEVLPKGLGILMKLLNSPRDSLVAQAVIVLKSVILSLPTSSTADTPDPRRLVARLAKGLDGMQNPKARASVFWLVGQYAESRGESTFSGLGWDGVVAWAPDVLRKGVKGFVEESRIAKLQILTLATKLVVLSPSSRQLSLICRYLFSLARYDIDYDVRDRGRFLHSLLRGVRIEQKALKMDGDTGSDNEGESDEEEDLGGVVLRREQVKVILSGKREVEQIATYDGLGEEYQVGSTSRILSKRLTGYAELPEWTDDPTDASLRESEVEQPKPVAVQATYTASPPPPGPPAGPTSPGPTVPPTNLATSVASLSRSSDTPPSSLPMQSTTRAKFKDLDKFLDSESESEEEDDSDSDDSEDDAKHEIRPTPLTAPPRSAIVPEYDESSDESEEETGSESDDGEEDKPLYGQYR